MGLVEAEGQAAAVEPARVVEPAGLAQPVEEVAPVVAKAAPGRVQQEAAQADPVQRARAPQEMRVRAMLAVQQRLRQVGAPVVVTPDMAGAAAPANPAV